MIENPKPILKNSKFVSSVSELRVRKFPSLSSPILTKLYKGQIINYLELKKDSEIIDGVRDYWVKIESDGGYKGWVFKKYIIPYEQSPHYLIKLAEDIENTDTNGALIIYQNILLNQADYKYDAGDHFPEYKNKILSKIEEMKCLQENNRIMINDQNSFIDYLKNTIRNNDSFGLKKAISCSFVQGRCHTGGFSTNTLSMKMIEKLLHDSKSFIWNTPPMISNEINKYQNEFEFFVKSKNDIQSGNVLVLSQDKNGWLWKSLYYDCETCFIFKTVNCK